MPEKRAFLLRIDAAVLEAYQRWAADELRSVNGQLEFVLRRALKQEGRKAGAPDLGPAAPSDGETDSKT